MNVLVLNCGSSSLKFQIIQTDLKSKKKNLLRNFIDSNYRVTRISVQMANIGTKDIDIKLLWIILSNGLFPRKHRYPEFNPCMIFMLSVIGSFMARNDLRIPR